MPKLIKNGQLNSEDPWYFLKTQDQLNTAITSGDWKSIPCFFDFTNLVSFHTEFLNSALTQQENITVPVLGLLLDNTSETEVLEPYLSKVSAIAIEFPLFSDGRAYSIARELCQLGFKGELRAVGDVLIDQLFFMKRCGFTAFALRDDQKTETALQALNTFSAPYQGAADLYKPVYTQY